MKTYARILGTNYSEGHCRYDQFCFCAVCKSSSISFRHWQRVDIDLIVGENVTKDA